MNRDELKAQLVEDVFNNEGNGACQILRQFHACGGEQRVAYDVLDEMLDPAKEVSEDLEDLVLDIMDIVVGYCHADRRIWEGYLEVE